MNHGDPDPRGPGASGTHRVDLVDAQRVLGMFAQGLTGRYLHLKPTGALTGKFRPHGVTTDGASIYLPESVEVFDSYRHNLGVYRIAVLHQLGLFESGTFGFSLQSARERLTELPDRDARDDSRADRGAVDLERFFSLWDAPSLMRRLFMLFEDLRIDLALGHRYPGARQDLARVLAHALATRPAIEELPALGAALEGLVRYTLGAARPALLDADASGLLEPLLDAASPVEAQDASVYDSARAAATCYRALERALAPAIESAGAERAPAPQVAGGHPGAGSEDGLSSLEAQGLRLAAVDFRGDVLPEMVQRQMRAGGTVGTLETVATAADETRQPPAADRMRLERQLEADRVVLYRTFGQLDAGPRSFLYDEWDFHRRAYSKGWCRLFERRLRGEDFDFIRGVRDRHAALARQVKRQFAFTRPETHRRVRRVREGEEIEIEAIVETVLDRRAGRVPDERVYMRRERSLREVAVAFLLDMSASTDYPIPDPLAAQPPSAQQGEDDPYLWAVRVGPDDAPSPAPAPRRVIDVAREALALMSEALETLGDSHAVYGFSGYGHDEVEFYVAKEFADRLSARTWAAIAQMQPRRSTRMGPAIRHAARKLRGQEARTRLLIVVSDGYPEDHDYGPDRGDHEYGIQDTGAALREAQRDGVQTFCVTIDRAGRDYLRRMCVDERYMVIDEIEALPEALTKVYRALTS